MKSHNFPTNLVVITSTAVNAEQAIEIVKACIKMDVKIYDGTVLLPVDPDYPQYSFDGAFVSQTKDSPESFGNSDTAVFVPVDEFIKFIKGKGNPDSICHPYKEIVTLNGRYEAVVKKGGVEVGCQTFSHEVITELYEASRRARGL